MPIPCPPFIWPDVLIERGPPDDPSILFTGMARIGGAPARIIAIRIQPGAPWEPDLRREVAEETYQQRGFDVVLGTVLEELQAVASELDEVLGKSVEGVVKLTTGTYKVWVMLVSEKS